MVRAPFAQEGTAARALEFTILTAARTSEVTGATVSEFSQDATTWTIPAPRIKGGKEHRIPLVARASAIVKDLMATSVRRICLPGAAIQASDQ